MSHSPETTNRLDPLLLVLPTDAWHGPGSREALRHLEDSLTVTLLYSKSNQTSTWYPSMQRHCLLISVFLTLYTFAFPDLDR